MEEIIPGPINLFIIYAREDKEIKHRLLAHLNPLKNAFNLIIWHDDNIEPGEEWKPHIESRLEQTDLFLLLVSVDFMNSEFIHQVEFKFAIDRHKANKSIMVPVIINYCQWDIDIRFKDYSFNLSELQVLPNEGLPIDGWKTPDQAYNNIAGGIKKVLLTIKNKRQEEGEKENLEKEKKERQKVLEKEKKERQAQKVRENEKERKRIAEAGEEKAQMFIAEEEEQPANKGISKKIIYLLVILFTVIIVCYFIFRDPGTQISGNHDSGDSIPVKENISSINKDSNKINKDVSAKADQIGKDTGSTPVKQKVSNGKERDGKVTDIDGNEYDVVVIGKQTWMKENLKTTHYRNGEPIPDLTGNTQWNNTKEGAFCDYKTKAATQTYGRLYNWYAVNDPSGLCPGGWHIPSDAEWKTLTTYLGENTAGDAMKTTTGWVTHSTSATNSSGFSGLGGGYHLNQEPYGNVRWFGYFWSSTERTSVDAFILYLKYESSNAVHSYFEKMNGISCRCIKD